MRVELDCGCFKDSRRIVGWLSCPIHGAQRVAAFASADPRDPLYERHLDRRRLFVKQHGVREIV